MSIKIQVNILSFGKDTFIDISLDQFKCLTGHIYWEGPKII